MSNGQKRALIAAGVVVAVLVLPFAIALATRPPATIDAVASPLVGKPAPQISGKSLLTGSPVSLAEYRGRFVVVNFFASWCDPCGQEAPELDSFAYEHRDGSAEVLGVVFQDESSTAAQFLQKTGGTYPAVQDPGSKIAIDYGIKGPPETFLVAPNGMVVAHFDGPVTRLGLDSYIAKAEREGL